MKKKSMLYLMTAFLILLAELCGCSTQRVDTSKPIKPEIALNERQKNILAEQDLPTEYEQLPSHQKRAIVAIEEMLTYAEDKYGMPFCYAGYAEAGPMEKENLQAYPADGFMAVDCFTITKTADGYEDDFLNVAAVPAFTDYLTRQFQAFLPDAEMQIYPNITNTTLQEVPHKDTVFDGKVSSSLYIFLDGATCTQADFDAFQTQCAAFMQEHELYGFAKIVLLKPETLIYVSRFNYTDYFSEETCDRMETISVQR